jgi:hypothetical protein
MAPTRRGIRFLHENVKIIADLDHSNDEPIVFSTGILISPYLHDCTAEMKGRKLSWLAGFTETDPRVYWHVSQETQFR